MKEMLRSASIGWLKTRLDARFIEASSFEHIADNIIMKEIATILE